MSAPRAVLSTLGGDVSYVPIHDALGTDPARVPVTTLILLEMQLRRRGVEAARRFVEGSGGTVPFSPTRIVCQDHSGIPAFMDLAAMRWSLRRAGLDPRAVEPVVPVDLVVDHSVEAFDAGTRGALEHNLAREYQQNRERYAFLHWADAAFDNLRVIPPGKGIIHQVHLEHLARVVSVQGGGATPLVCPDTVLGTDSHTPMINSIGVLGFGVGGIDAEAVMLGHPLPLADPQVVGVRLTGAPPPGSTVTDVVLLITEWLRQHDIVGRFLEFHGPALAALNVYDRATIANMAPEYGATCALFPVDRRVLDYLMLVRGDRDLCDLVERYTKEQGLFREDGSGTDYTRRIDIDLSEAEPCVAGPRRPQDRLPLRQVPASLGTDTGGGTGTAAGAQPAGGASAHGALPGSTPADAAVADAAVADGALVDGALAIAAITSCTNTANPAGMVTAGLVARNAVRLGLRVPDWVKTSLAPGSQVVTRYLDEAGLLPDLEKLGFHVVGYGCTTCIGNSGPLTEQAAGAADSGVGLAAVLSGNRNFEGRIHGQVKWAYLASPGLVVAWALAGSVRLDLTSEPLGATPEGRPVMLADIWPESDEVEELVRSSQRPELYRAAAEDLFEGGTRWESVGYAPGDLFAWDPESTYLVEPPFFGDEYAGSGLRDITGARVLVHAGDFFTTDHISPAGEIPLASPAGRHLAELGVSEDEFGTFGCRRGNHEVLAKGTFGNVRLRNRLVPERTGGWTRTRPSAAPVTVQEAAAGYAKRGVPAIVLAGTNYGMGSSRDWAAKGPYLLGVRAILARDFERIHRSNLVGMGILPLRLPASADELGLSGFEEYDLVGLEVLEPGGPVTVRVREAGAPVRHFIATACVQSAQELEYLRHGGVLRLALHTLMSGASPAG
ncbi:aconitate hydratase AcnA [Streptomyces sp. NPDC050164]|uniref:aconitate hydratase AcnA n=1 Tax=Streptomyces sp. NPDC050164 TaxID=3365605 RepID=UPI00379E16B2